MDRVVQDHWIPTSEGHELHVAELAPQASPACGASVLCLHGVFSDSRFFVGHAGGGAGRYLADQGFRVFLGDLRGHGRSRWPAGRHRWNWSFDTCVRHDIPDLIRFAADRNPGPLFMLAHSFGGCALLAALGTDPTLQQRLAGVSMLGAAVNDCTDGGLSKRIQLSLSSLVATLCGRMPARLLRLGPSDEPAALMRQFRQWAVRGTFETLDRQHDYWDTLAAVTVPVYAGVGVLDNFHATPARARKLVDALGSHDITFEIFGRAQGCSIDFGHINIATGHHAEQDVFPRLRHWMAQRCP